MTERDSQARGRLEGGGAARRSPAGAARPAAGGAGRHGVGRRAARTARWALGSLALMGIVALQGCGGSRRAPEVETGTAGASGSGAASVARGTASGSTVAGDTGAAAVMGGTTGVLEVGPGAPPEQPGSPQDSALWSMAAGMLPQLEVMSGLRATRPIRFARRTQAQLRAYLERQQRREMPPPQLNGIEGVYRALGLIPDTLNLGRLLLNLYTEQVVGFYDGRTKVLYVMDKVPAASLRTVLAHEMVHALQDMHTNVDSLLSPRRGNDRQMAAQAALEGQATLIMYRELQAQRLGHPVPPSALPDMGAEIKAELPQSEAKFPVFRAAPPIIQNATIYPYAAGASFVQALWKRYPNAAPLDSLLPLSTEQVSHPDTRFFGTRDWPTEIHVHGQPSPAASGAASDSVTARWGWHLAGWRVDYTNTMGQDELSVLLDAYLGSGGHRFADGWDGDRYLLLSRGGTRLLVWYLVWDDAASANAFAGAYRRVLAARPGRTGTVQRLTVQGRPVVRIVDGPRGADLAAAPRASITLSRVRGS